MIVLGLIGRPDRDYSHDAAACLLIDGRLAGALEQERISRRRYAMGEGPQDAVAALLRDNGLHPRDVDAIGYAWGARPDEDVPRIPLGVSGTASVSPEHTDIILPALAGEFRSKDIHFFDHHLCHAAQTYWMNPYDRADVLVVDGSGGDGSSSLYQVADGGFRLLERHGVPWSLGILYEAAAYYANLGWNAAGKLMGLSSYGAPTGRTFLDFDPARGEFALTEASKRMPAGTLASSDGGLLVESWLEIFADQVFPYSARSGNPFDYASFAADVQASCERAGLGLVDRLRRLSGGDTLLLSGGVALNAHLNRRIAAESGYRTVAATPCPQDGGTALGAAFLTAALLGDKVEHLTGTEEAIRLGPDADSAGLAAGDRFAVTELDPAELNRRVAERLAAGAVVAWCEGRSEFGPRALGARSLLAAPAGRETLDRLNVIKGRQPWRPAALAITADGFDQLGVESPWPRLSEYMLCAHPVEERGARTATAGVHVDRTSRAQLVPAGTPFGALLDQVGATTGVPALINTSLNTRGEPMVQTARQALTLYADQPEVDLLVVDNQLIERG